MDAISVVILSEWQILGGLSTMPWFEAVQTGKFS